MILSHMAPACHNISSYRAIWTYVKFLAFLRIELLRSWFLVHNHPLCPQPLVVEPPVVSFIIRSALDQPLSFNACCQRLLRSVASLTIRCVINHTVCLQPSGVSLLPITLCPCCQSPCVWPRPGLGQILEVWEPGNLQIWDSTTSKK